MNAMSDADKPLPEDAAIAAAFPTRSGRHDLYAEALRLVGARHSKGGLVALVNWLLLEREAFKERADVATDAVKVAEALARELEVVRLEREQAEHTVYNLLDVQEQENERRRIIGAQRDIALARVEQLEQAAAKRHP